MLRAALHPQAVIWVIEPLTARIAAQPARRYYSASRIRAARKPLLRRSTLGDAPKPLLERSTLGDEHAEKGARWAAEQRSVSDGYYVKRYKEAFHAFSARRDFDLDRGRVLLQDLVAWPDVREVEEPDDEPPSLADAPETLHLLDDFMQLMKKKASETQNDDPFLLLLALRGYTELADLSPAAEAQRAALEERILQVQPTWWKPATVDPAGSSDRSVSKLTGKPSPTESGHAVPITEQQAGEMIQSADYIRRHPRYAANESLYSAWNGQAIPPPSLFHHKRLFRLISSIDERMDEGGIHAPNSSGLPDMPYAQVRSFLAPALLHAPEDPFILLGALRLLAATFNTAVAGRTQAAMLIAEFDIDNRRQLTAVEWLGVDTVELRAIFEGAAAAYNLVEPLLDERGSKFLEPLMEAKRAIRRRVAGRISGSEERARQRGFRNGTEAYNRALPSAIDKPVRSIASIGGAAPSEDSS